MGQYLHTYRWYHSFLALCLTLLIVGIPITQAFHTHSDEAHLCAEHHGHEHHHDTESQDNTSCDLCQFYAHFAPKEPYLFSIFSFDTPLVAQSVILDSYLAIYDGRTIHHSADRGPPSFFPLLLALA